MKICGSERDRNQWPSRYCGGSGTELDTPSGSQHPAPHAKPRPGARRGRGREAGFATVGGGDQLVRNDKSSPECDGRGSLMAYAPLGAMGISK